MTDIVSADRLAFVDGAYAPALSREFPEITGDVWDVNDSGFDHYCQMAQFNGNPQGLVDLLIHQIGTNPRNVGLDIAGGTNGIAIRDLMKRRILGSGAVTNYFDNHVIEIEGVEHLKGDLLKRDTWQQIIGWQQRTAPDGLALIMHRPIAGIQRVNFDFYRGAIQQLLDMVRPEGAVFCQLPMPFVGDEVRGRLAVVEREILSRPDVKRIVQSDTLFPRKGRWPVPGFCNNFVFIEKASA